MNPAYRHVQAARARLDSTFDRVRAVPFEQMELRADGARYLSVLVSGFLETSVVNLIVSYVGGVSHPRAHRLAERSLAKTTSMKAERLCQLVGRLDADWERDLRAYLADEGKAALDSLVALRHDIAHGGQAGVTLVTVTSYYEAVIGVVEYLAALLDPTGAGERHAE